MKANRAKDSYKSWQQKNRKSWIYFDALSLIRRLKIRYLPIFMFWVFLTAFICIKSSPLVAQIKTTQILETHSLNSLQQGKKLYEAGQFNQSIELLQQAVNNYQKQGNKLRQAIALSNLALVYQQLGQLNEAQQAIIQSLNLLEQLPSAQNLAVFASSLNIQGSIQLDLGQTEDALETWQGAEAIYQQLDDQNGVIRTRLNQAQAWQILGFYRRGLNILTELKQELELEPNSLTKADRLL